MRRDLYTMLHWAIVTAREKHPNSVVTYEEYIKIAQNVWMDMVESGEFDRPIKKESDFKTAKEFKEELDRQKNLGYVADFFKNQADLF